MVLMAGSLVLAGSVWVGEAALLLGAQPLGCLRLEATPVVGDALCDSRAISGAPLLHALAPLSPGAADVMW